MPTPLPHNSHRTTSRSIVVLILLGFICVSIPVLAQDEPVLEPATNEAAPESAEATGGDEALHEQTLTIEEEPIDGESLTPDGEVIAPPPLPEGQSLVPDRLDFNQEIIQEADGR